MSKTVLRSNRFKPRPLDLATFAGSMARPGADTRQWVSYGRVTAADGKDIVIFDVEEGQVFVQVTLEPSRKPVMCRVGSMAAGNGEGEYFPYVEGDEVLVAIPEGSERAGCVIISRLNNQIDRFPMESVAGQDPTTNSFGFSRRRTPHFVEYAGPITLRSALNDGMIAIDTGGAVTIRDTNGSSLQISADAVSLMGQSEPGAAPKYVFQMNMTDGQYTLQAEDSILNLSASSAKTQNSNITVLSQFTLQNSGNAAIEHVTTTEQVAQVILHVLASLATYLNTLPASVAPTVTGGAIGTIIGAWLNDPRFAAAWSTAAITPLGAAPLALPPVANVGLGTVIAGAVAAQAPKQPTLPLQLFPGVACQGFFTG